MLKNILKIIAYIAGAWLLVSTTLSIYHAKVQGMEVIEAMTEGLAAATAMAILLVGIIAVCGLGLIGFKFIRRIFKN